MTLPAGTRLGAYEILSPLGAGGMGEVYRARDAKLKRDVAIKVLPDALAKDPDALARFEREAHAVAALNHPNILSIHDFGEFDGVVYAVTELLDGETLRSRLDAGRPTSRQAVEIAMQMVRGLAAAHEKGIVHRDLKPENVFVTSDGRVKLLDFGLAKRVGIESADTNAPTSAGATEPGTVMGTVGYMSPEQVRGRDVDARTDIFSFGAILHEMLSGRRAFHRDSAVETMHAILAEEPPELAESGGNVSPALDRLVRHCIEKNPTARFHSASDVAFALEVLAAGGPSGSAPAVAATAPAVRLRRIAFAGGAVIGAIGLFLAGRSVGRRRGLAPPAPVAFRQVTELPGVESSPSLAPDGKSVVYVAETAGRLAIYQLRIGGRNAELLTPDSIADDWQPAFSPDGTRIAFRSERDGGGIFLMGATGESQTRLTDFGYHPTWSPNGKEIAVSTSNFDFPSDRADRNAAIWAVDVASGRRRPVCTGGDAVQPSWSPHGRRIAFWGVRGDSGQRDLWTVAADGSEAKGEGLAVTRDAALDWSPVWAPDGKYLYFSSDRGGTMNLWRIAIEEASGRPRGAPEPVTVPASWAGHATFSKDGSRFAYASLDWRSTLLRVPFDPAKGVVTGPPVTIFRSSQPIRDHQVSPDGQWIAYMQAGTREDIVVVRADGTQYRRLTDDAYRDRGPAWSPDGRTIAFYSDRTGNYELWSIRPDGSGLEQLTRSASTANFPVWSPDGSRIAMSLIGKGWAVVDMRSSTFPRPLKMMPPDPKGAFWPLSWSPDGRRVAGILFPAGTNSRPVDVYSFESGSYQAHPTGSEGFFVTPLWLDDARLLVRTRRGIGLVVPATGENRLLIPVGGYATGMSIGVSKDRRSITYTETGTEGDIWTAEMR